MWLIRELIKILHFSWSPVNGYWRRTYHEAKELQSWQWQKSRMDHCIYKKISKTWRFREPGKITDFIFYVICQLINFMLFLQFVYVNQAFSPSPDQSVGNLCECFGSEGKLVLYYSKTQAWG